MRRHPSILVPNDGSPEAAKALACAAWLAQRLGGEVHVLQESADPVAALPGAIAAHGAQLVVMTARGASAGADPEKRLGHVAAALMRESSAPVLVLPRRYREALPWRSMLVAASGEPAADQALDAALGFAAALGLAVEVLYCESPRTRAGALGAYADAPHHEYAQRLEEMVRRSAGQRPAEERERIARVLLCHGDPAAQLLAQLGERGASVLALGWAGALGPGRAPVLKRLLEESEVPLLVVREAPRPQARLRVGEDLPHEAG